MVLMVGLLVIGVAFGKESKQPLFQEKEFWNNLYSKTNSSENDWFQQWRHPMISRKGGTNLADVIMPFLESLGSKCHLRLLHIGCGTSSMPEQMLGDGFLKQVCIDTSDVAMKALNDRFKHVDLDTTNQANISCHGVVPSMQFFALDAANTGFDDNSFDIVLDKGTLDAQVGGPSGMSEVAATLEEAVRLLRGGGIYVQMSHSAERSLALEKRLDGTPRPWHAEPGGTTGPLEVLAPIAYAKTSNATTPTSNKRKKDTTYIYIYRRGDHSKVEL